ncbi:hypothetical protein [Pseudarthrobacter oxydans]|uniref:hypothetical protein n=1 Tax=Pseudarthrobacter oxydans TaxID=1671 RepID=UPI00380E897A
MSMPFAGRNWLWAGRAAGLLEREYKDIRWDWVIYAGVIMILAVGIPQVLAYEIGWGAVATAVGGACIT